MPRYTVCPYHDKRSYKRRPDAQRAADAANDPADPMYSEGTNRVFWCPRAGGWHVTSISQAEMDRRQASKSGGRPLSEDPHQKWREHTRRMSNARRAKPKPPS